MPLHIEQVCAYVKDFARTNYPLALANLCLEQDAQLNVTAPAPDSYFLGEPNRYTPLQPPALFVNPARTRRFDVNTQHSFDTVLYQEHALELIVLVEDVGEEQLTRVCMRHAQAVDALINEFELEPGVITQHKAVAHVTDIDYGVTYTRTRDNIRMFSKDITLAVLVQHWDQYAQLPLQTQNGTNIVSTTGQRGGILVNASESTLSTTSPTIVLTNTPSAAGNFGLYLYVRVTISATLTMTVAWTDASGAQSLLVVNGAQSVGSYLVSPLYFSAIASSTITVTATAGLANAVTVSASLEALS